MTRVRLKAVLFDIDGVLVESVRANAQYYRDLLCRFGLHGPTDDEQRLRNHLPLSKAIRVHAPGQEESVYERILAAVRTVPYHDEFMEVPDDAKTLLVRLSGQYRLGLVSSRIRLSVDRFLDYSGFRSYFRAIVSVEDTPEHKPHPGPLLKAAERLGIVPAEGIYVGDAATDVEAARAAGMPVIYYGRDPHPLATYSVTRLADVLAVVERHG